MATPPAAPERRPTRLDQTLALAGLLSLGLLWAYWPTLLAMMSLALGVLWVELELLARLFVGPGGARTVPSPVAVESGRPRRADAPEVAAPKRARRNP